VAALAAYLADQLGRPIAVVNQIDWQERDRLLDEGQIDIGWICRAVCAQDAPPAAQTDAVGRATAGRGALWR
jgi:ABC-type phosphate/phosphonate transport system substrate-binding protein